MTKGGKLIYRFLGPYRITNALPGGVYQLSDAEGNVSRATGGHLKLYQTNESEDNLSAQLPPSPTESELCTTTCTAQNTSVTFIPCEEEKTSEFPATAAELRHCEVLPKIDQDLNHTTKEQKSHA